MVSVSFLVFDLTRKLCNISVVLISTVPGKIVIKEEFIAYLICFPFEVKFSADLFRSA
jgi:hypothetical protein